ncbi:MAG: hypothetical protein E6G10_23550 [Actinobacteria bacterium]|nr:MAG: hypothetical protein E6G10_23550 [Actinomycetota bacterium]
MGRRRTRLRDARHLAPCSSACSPNAVLGWWWADPATALVIAGVAVREGREAWRGDGCSCCAA